MSTILDVLESKGTDLHCIDPNATVLQAVQRMVEYNIGSLLVTDGALRDYTRCMRGIVTERDYLSKVVIRGKTSKQTPVADIMSQLRRVVGPHDDVDTCLGVMTEERIRHLPVVAGERILGIVSIGDLTKRKLAEQRTELDQIVGYLQGVPTQATFESICYGRGETIQQRPWFARRQRTLSAFDLNVDAHGADVERWRGQ